MLGGSHTTLHRDPYPKQFMASVLLLAAVIIAAFLWTIYTKDADPAPIAGDALASEPAHERRAGSPP